jgi:uncharacterized peroxidase-related enzyme
MPEFAIHTVDSAPEESKETLKAVGKQFGSVPNLLGELAAAPASLKAYVALSDLLSQTSLRPVEQQLVLAVASLANACQYCVAAHSMGLKAAGLPEPELQALRRGGSLQDRRLEALRVFVKSVVDNRGRVEEPELQRLLDAGFRREQVFEVLVGVAMKTLSNYANHIAGTPLDQRLQPFAWAPVSA